MHPFIAKAEIVLDPIIPAPLIALLGVVLAGLTIAIYVRVGSRLGPGRNFLLILFRLLGLALALLLLLQPSRREAVPPPTTQKVTLVAVDTSRSMRQADVAKVARLEVAKNTLRDAEVITPDGRVQDSTCRVFEFSDDALPVAGPVLDLTAHGLTTRFHKSLLTILASLGGGEAAKALLLLTDGHDFELVNPAQTGFLARSRQVPIYAIPIGRQGKVRDVSARLTSYQPYCYVKQKARLSATLRLIGCEYEDLLIQLLRQNQVVQTQRLNAEEQQQKSVQFEVVEPQVGQYEYEIRVQPLENEVDLNNNSALTCLNVIDQQIQVLLLEGSPYWDTTFLQRSLARNDKLSVDAIAQYTPKKARLFRKETMNGALKMPRTVEEFQRYDVIILGRCVDQLMNRDQLQALASSVRDYGTTVVFCRGPAFEGDLAANELEPILWSRKTTGKVRLQVGRDGQSLAPMRILADKLAGADSLPELVGGRTEIQRKPLTATLASGQGGDGSTNLPGIVHRRFGQGQVLSVGVDGLWRWAFHANLENASNLYDRFWDQMILWLVSARDFIPNQTYSFRTISANVQLGEKVYFRLLVRDPNIKLAAVPLTVSFGGQPVGQIALAANEKDHPGQLTAEFLPDKPGKHRAELRLPDGTRQESNFIVFDENQEDTEVTTDVVFLKRLCEHSGGRLLAPDELGKLLKELRQEKVDAAPKIKLTSLWDQHWTFYGLGLLFGIDWYLRRRWGLC